MTAKLLFTLLTVCPIFALDTTSEIAQVREAITRASIAHDAVAFGKLLTPDFYATARTGVLRDRGQTIDHIQDRRPTDLKLELIKTAAYGDTVIQTFMQSWTANDGAKHTSYLSEVFVKQAGSWKLAARFGTDIPPAK